MTRESRERSFSVSSTTQTSKSMFPSISLTNERENSKTIPSPLSSSFSFFGSSCKVQNIPTIQRDDQLVDQLKWLNFDFGLNLSSIVFSRMERHKKMQSHKKWTLIYMNLHLDLIVPFFLLREFCFLFFAFPANRLSRKKETRNQGKWKRNRTEEDKKVAEKKLKERLALISNQIEALESSESPTSLPLSPPPSLLLPLLLHFTNDKNLEKQQKIMTKRLSVM